MKAAFEEAAKTQAGEGGSDAGSVPAEHDEGDPANAVEPDVVE